VAFLDSETLLVTAPRGAGSQLSVDVVTAGTLRSPANRAFSYFAPAVTSLVPQYAFTGDILSDFSIQGRELGSSLEDLDAVRVGG